MAFDGIVVANLVQDFNNEILNGKISKIAQPEMDELILTIKGAGGQRRLCISASASLPLIYLTDTNKPSPMTAPNFCMLLRKHIGNGKIVKIHQPGLERIIVFTVEHFDELGDLGKKELIVEIMGKHSNIIFCNEQGVIIDSIKHVSINTSSVREVLPGRNYFIPDTMEKVNPLDVSFSDFDKVLINKSVPLSKAIYTSFTGISPVMAEEICDLSRIDSDIAYKDLTDELKLHFFNQFNIVFSNVRDSSFSPTIYYDGELPIEFSSLPLTHLGKYEYREMPSASQMVEIYFATKNTLTRIRQKSMDLRQVIQTLKSRNHKKYDLQLKQLQDTENRDINRVYGELINTYGYNLGEGAKVLEAHNYYDDTMVTIPLDPGKTPGENANKYFSKYNKQKRTYSALSKLIEETKNEIEYLDSISNSLEIALNEDDLIQIKEELVEAGYIKRKLAKNSKKKEKIKSKPFHYRSTDGFDIYIGKNNLQNDYITFELATGNDWWFHAKKAPGSHVVLKSKGMEVPNRAIEEAGKLAAYYSTMRGEEKVEIDYIKKKHVKKPKGGKPGFVIYHSNYSMIIDSDIRNLELID